MKHITIFGTRISPLTIDDLHRLIKDGIQGEKQKLIISQNLHSLYLQFKDEKLRSIQNSAVVRVDGMPLIWILNGFGYKGINREHRVTWMDWKDHFFDFCQDNGYRLFYLGSKPELQIQIAKFVSTNYPKLNFGMHHGYFEIGSSQEDDIQRVINQFVPDILLVGMGMPRQEYWIWDNKDRSVSKVFLSCGAAMEYLIGHVSIPPRWIGQIGLEWLYRLIENPGRFWRRYLLEPVLLVLMIMTRKK